MDAFISNDKISSFYLLVSVKRFCLGFPPLYEKNSLIDRLLYHILMSKLKGEFNEFVNILQ